jgi:hypothetical protein
MVSAFMKNEIINTWVHILNVTRGKPVLPLKLEVREIIKLVLVIIVSVVIILYIKVNL